MVNIYYFQISIAKWTDIFFLLFDLLRLPIIIGAEAMKTFGLNPVMEGFSNDYRANIDPRITNEFATAGLRMGHSIIPGIAE